MSYNSFEDMAVWKKAMNLGTKIFEITARLPKKEDFGLTSQIRRAALSISGNIAEGFGRKHAKDKSNFYYNARGSLSETKNYLIYANKVGYFTNNEYYEITAIIEDVWKELNCLIASFSAQP